MRVVVMGVGFCGAFPASGGLSYREMIARAAAMAYDDAGIRAEDLDGAVSCEEDFASGYSIADEYVPDQLGVPRKAVYTICGDFLQGLASAVMQIQTGRYRRLVVESYSKASNVLGKNELLHFAYDPIWSRLGVTPTYMAAIEMQHHLRATGRTVQDVAEVVVANRTRARKNPLAPYATPLDLRDVLEARPVATPLTEAMIARPADGAVAVVLGAQDVALPTARKPIAIAGTGWCSGTSSIEQREHATSQATRAAARTAYREAGIEDPRGAFDVVYVSDLFAHRQTMHLDAMDLAGSLADTVNPDGGSLAGGDLFEATGGARLFDAVRQLRGEAGAHQVEGARRAVVQGWRGLPTDSCAVVVLDAEGSR